MSTESSLRDPLPNAVGLCALEGCEAPIVQQDRGGRPKRYCSDAHRSLARRRRLRAGGAGHQALAAQAVDALRQAVTIVEEALASSSSGLDAELVETRAAATAQVLDAHRLAADATRQLEAARRRFDEDRGRLEAALAAGREREARDTRAINELQAALEGARAELEEELLQHHRDVQALAEARARRDGGGAVR
jgi:hypothetical protein